MKANYIILCLVSCVLSACGDSTSKEQTNAQEVTNIDYKYKLTPFASSPAFTDASIAAYNYKDGKFSFDVRGTDYRLGEQTPDAASKMCANSAKGQHIHLIVDNAPYAAKYTADFDYELPSGDHAVLAFLSRSYHESIKTGQAHTAKMVTVAGGEISNSTEITEPVLFYSRPKGTYVGEDTKKVMLDFYLVNAQLGAKYKVKANINGEDHILEKWQPYYIEGLPMGINSVTLALIDADGKTAEVPLNPVTRKFTLVENLDAVKQ